MSENTISIIFFGSDEFSTYVLSKLYSYKYINILQIVTKKEKKSGRGGILQSSPLVKLASHLNIPVIKVSSLLKNPKQLKNVSWNNFDYAVVASFGYIIPDEILGQMPNRFINVHPSLLPKYRGPSPIEHTIINGDTTTGNTIMILDSGIDTGPILTQKSLKVGKNMTNLELKKALATEGAKLLAKTLLDYKKGLIKPRKQNDSNATYTKIFKRHDGFVTLQEPVHIIYNKYRAFMPWPGIYTTVKNLEDFAYIKTKIKDKNAIVKLIEVLLDSKGNLQIQKVQLPNKKAINWNDFLNGYTL